MKRAKAPAPVTRVAPPPPFAAGQRVTLAPSLLARYPLWKPKGDVTVLRVEPDFDRAGAFTCWTLYAKVGKEQYMLGERDLVG